MVATVQSIGILGANGEPLIELDALQGTWTKSQYLKMTEHTNKLVEFTDGAIERLPMPTDHHQSIIAFLYELLRAYLQPRGGKVHFAALQLQVGEDKFREPDLLLLLDAKDPRRQNSYWLGADMVVEVVSPDNPERDLVIKRADYAEAGIPEYWIVHPEAETVTVLAWSEGQYREHGVFKRGEVARSVLLEGFSVNVDVVLDAD